MKLTIGMAAVVGVLMISAQVRADDGDGEGSAAFSHRGQFGVHAHYGTGYRVLFPYDQEYCGQLGDAGDPKSVCTARLPSFFDVGLSFGVTKSLELLGEVRIGLENDFAQGAIKGPKQFGLAAGLRLYVSAEGAFKFWSSIEGEIDTTDYSKTTNGKNGPLGTGADLGLRNTNGVQIDLHRSFGLYFMFGETVSFVRWLDFELHVGGGVQIRFP